MNQKVKDQQENTVEKEELVKPRHKRSSTEQRQKIRQLLRSFLPMDDEYRQLKEEQTLFR